MYIEIVTGWFSSLTSKMHVSVGKNLPGVDNLLISILPSNHFLQVCLFFFCIYIFFSSLAHAAPEPGKTMLQSQLANSAPDRNLYDYMFLMKLCQRTTVADPVLCLEVEFSTI